MHHSFHGTPHAISLRMATIGKTLSLMTGMLLLATGRGHGNEPPPNRMASTPVAEASVAAEATAASQPNNDPRESVAGPRDLSGLFKKNGTGADQVSSGTSSEDADAIPLSRSPDWSLLRSIVAVILTLGGLVALNRFLRRRMQRAATDDHGEQMRLIGALPLDHQRRLLLIAVEGKRALLCSGRDGVTSIATFDPPAAVRHQQPGTDQAEN
jgi:flagellar biogenesis protein FliO